VVGVDDFELLPQAVTAIPVAAISATTARLLVMRKEIPLVGGLLIRIRSSRAFRRGTAFCTLPRNLGRQA
jgi:hypothetical protein